MIFVVDVPMSVLHPTSKTSPPTIFSHFVFSPKSPNPTYTQERVQQQQYKIVDNIICMKATMKSPLPGVLLFKTSFSIRSSKQDFLLKTSDICLARQERNFLVFFSCYIYIQLLTKVTVQYLDIWAAQVQSCFQLGMILDEQYNDVNRNTHAFSHKREWLNYFIFCTKWFSLIGF